MQIENISWLQQALINLDLVDEAAYQKTVSELLDEQPHLMGFLFNLEEEFAENPHELLLRAAVAFQQSLVSIGLNFKTVSPALLEEVISQKVDLFNALDGAEEGFDEQLLFHKTSSPQAVKSLIAYIDQNTMDTEFDAAARNNMLLILSALVELFEEAIATGNEPKPTNT
jgi:hypothetical protein